MATNVRLLDCTLRDGGYVNDWDFGHSVLTGTFKRLDAAGVDYIEIGFLDDRRPFDENRSIMPSTEAADRIFSGVKKKHAMAVAMIDYGTCSLDHIAPHTEDSFIDGIRVIFKKERIDEALPFCKAVKEKGYKLSIQAISITAYSDSEMLAYVERINEVHPYAFSIVDTYGLLDETNMRRYFSLIDHNLLPDIALGYHDHNNFQLAFSNTCRFLSMNTDRLLIADSTVYGMGKSAGNCASELLALHLNQYYHKNYNLDLLLEIIDTDLMPIYQSHYWGYKYDFYISAMQACHPNYVKYLLDKKTLSISSVNSILARIPAEKKLLYDQKWVEQAYIDFQSMAIDDHKALDMLRKDGLEKKKVVLLGPGESIRTEADQVKERLADDNVEVIAVGFYTDNYPINYIFLSNGKRYSMLADSKQAHPKMIITSNITALPDFPADLTLNYSSLIDTRMTNVDNSLMLVLRLLIKLGVKEVQLAGFDGFTGADTDYYSRTYKLHKDSPSRLNDSISADLRLLKEEIALTFITPTQYRI